MPRCTFVQYYSLFAMTFLLFHWPHDKCPYSTTFRNLGWDPKDGESHLDAMLRPVLLDALVKLGHDKTIHEGARRFRIFVHGHNTSLLPSDTRKVAYLAVMQNVTSSNRSGYDDLLKVYRQTVEAEEKARVLGMWILNLQKRTLTKLAGELTCSEWLVSLF